MPAVAPASRLATPPHPPSAAITTAAVSDRLPLDTPAKGSPQTWNVSTTRPRSQHSAVNGDVGVPFVTLLMATAQRRIRCRVRINHKDERDARAKFPNLQSMTHATVIVEVAFKIADTKQQVRYRRDNRQQVRRYTVITSSPE
jgi:hypothetical protein